MTGSAAAAGVAGPCHFTDRSQSVSLYLTFDSAFGNEEAGANERFVADPIFTRGIAVFANGGKQCVTNKSRTVFVVPNNSKKCRGLLSDNGGIGRRLSDHPFR